MIMPALLALSIGVFQSTPTFTRVIVKVRHQGPSLPVTLRVRTKENIKDEWQYLKTISYFPKRIRTSPIGRRVSLVIPGNLKKYRQVCSLYSAVPESGQAFQVLFSLESCANLPQPEHRRRLSFLRPVVTQKDPLLSSPLLLVTPAVTHHQISQR